MGQKVHHLHNFYHLGDNIFNMLLFKNIKKYIEDNQIIIYYYCQPEYIKQVSEFNDSQNVIIKEIDKKPHNSFELWIDREIKGFSWTKLHNKNVSIGKNRTNYDTFFVYFFNIALHVLNIRVTLKKFYYKDKDLKHRYINLNKKHKNKYKNIQVLILNSQPLSGQFNYNKSEWDDHINHLSKKYNVITTTKVDGIACTMDDKLSVKDIAAISAKAKIIIAINSGVVPGLLNKYTLNNVKQVYIFDNRCKFSYKKFQNKENIREINYEELNKYA